MAIRILSHIERAVLVVVGGDDRAPYVSLARQAGVADRVHFLGLQKDMAPFYRAADVLIHPTRYDPFANVCLEACACGTPVVTTLYNGFSDLLQDRRGGGVMHRNDDPAGTARLITALQKGRAGRESARIGCSGKRYQDACGHYGKSVPGLCCSDWGGKGYTTMSNSIPVLAYHSISVVRKDETVPV